MNAVAVESSGAILRSFQGHVLRGIYDSTVAAIRPEAIPRPARSGAYAGEKPRRMAPHTRRPSMSATTFAEVINAMPSRP